MCALVGFAVLAIFITMSLLKHPNQPLIAYADESYLLDGKSDVIAIAGWLSDEESVNKFCAAWKKVLDCYGVNCFRIVSKIYG
jgi:hypothetical protein